MNNAGITRDGLMVRMKESDWDLVLSINLKGSFLCSQQAVKQMMKQKRIIRFHGITSMESSLLPFGYSLARGS